MVIHFFSAELNILLAHQKMEHYCFVVELLLSTVIISKVSPESCLCEEKYICQGIL